MENNIEITNFTGMIYDFGFRRGLREAQKVLTDTMTTLVRISGLASEESQKVYEALDDVYSSINELELEWDEKQNYYVRKTGDTDGE